MDTVGDFLTVVRNASRVRKPTCEVSYSKLRGKLANILKAEGYLSDVREAVNENGIKRLVLDLKYVDSTPALTVLRRCSTPGCRWYVSGAAIPKVLNGLGTSILSTSKGVMCDREARRMGVGGELICQVW